MVAERLTIHRYTMEEEKEWAEENNPKFLHHSLLSIQKSESYSPDRCFIQENKRCSKYQKVTASWIKREYG